MKWQQTVLYEQPNNEQVRLCLRLESLFEQVQRFLPGAEPWHTRLALDALLEIVTLIDRPDVKSLLTKELSRHQVTLGRLLEIPQIDQGKLQSVLNEIDTTVTTLNTYSGKLAQSIRENDFLNNIRMYRSNPGGICHFDIPAYHFWLQRPHSVRVQQISQWLHELDVINHTSQLILRLVRESSVPEYKTATEGLFQMAMDPKVPCQLIRVILPAESNVYPEISVGKHRLYIRFLTTTAQSKPVQTNDDVEFKLVCCTL